MKPIETSLVARSRSLGTETARSVRNAPETPGAAVTPPAAPGVIAGAKATTAGMPTFDNDRVSEIRSALREGTYPLNPTRVADAMIAANFILIEGRNN